MNTNNQNFSYSDQYQNQNHYILKKLSEKKNLSIKEVFDVVSNILDGSCSDVFISAFLMSLLLKGESLDEISGTVKAIKSKSETRQRVK